MNTAMEGCPAPAGASEEPIILGPLRLELLSLARLGDVCITLDGGYEITVQQPGPTADDEGYFIAPVTLNPTMSEAIANAGAPASFGAALLSRLTLVQPKEPLLLRLVANEGDEVWGVRIPAISRMTLNLRGRAE